MMLRQFALRRFCATNTRLVLGGRAAWPVSRLGVLGLQECGFLQTAGCTSRAQSSVRRNLDTYTTTATNNSEPTPGASSSNCPSPPDEGESSTTIVDSSLWKDPMKIPVGDLSLRDFLDTEEMLTQWVESRTPTQKSVEHAFLIYRRLVQEIEANPSLLGEYDMVHWLTGRFPRSAVLLNRVLAHWFQWRTKHPYSEYLSPSEVLSILDNWTSGEGITLPITEDTYIFLISAATKGSPQEAPGFAEHLFDRMLDESYDSPWLQPSSRSCETVLRAWAKSGLAKGPEMAERFLQNWTELYESELLDELPTTAACLIVMKTWASSEQECAPYKVEEILQAKMISSNRVGLKANVAAYRIAIHAWVNSEEDIAGSRAYALLVSLVRKYLAGDEDAKIDADFFSAVIRKLAKEKRCEMAEEVFRLLEEFHATTDDPSFKLDEKRILALVMVKTFNGDFDSVKKAESMLMDLQEEALANGDYQNVPKRGYYGDLISAYIALHYTGKNGAVDRAEALLLKMIELHFEGVRNMLPSALLFDQILRCWAKQQGYRQDAAERADALLNTMRKTAARADEYRLKPTERCYWHAMTAWSQAATDDAPHRAEKLFFEMLNDFQRGDSSMKPNKSHYTALITCWARSGSPDALVCAQRIFNEVISLYKSGDKSYRPDNKLCNSFLRALAKAGFGRDAETVLQYMLEAAMVHQPDAELLPDTFAFNQVLEAWSVSGDSEAAERATRLFDAMVELSSTSLPGAAPDGSTLQLMIDIISKSKLDASAEHTHIYLEMLKDSVLSENRHFKSHVFRSYVLTIVAWSRNDHPQSKSKAAALIEELQQLIRSGIVPLPTKKEYIRFLLAVAKSGIPEKAERAALKLRLTDEQLNVTQQLLPETG